MDRIFQLRVLIQNLPRDPSSLGHNVRIPQQVTKTKGWQTSLGSAQKIAWTPQSQISLGYSKAIERLF